MAKTNSPSKSRRALMFLLGATEGEVHRCLQGKKNQLIRLGAKADNIPPNPDKRAEFISRLPKAAMDVVRDWFADNVDFAQVHDPADACDQLAKDVDGSMKSVDKHKLLWRSVLAAYVKPGSPAAIEAFLADERRGPGKVVDSRPKQGPGGISEQDASAILGVVDRSQANGLPTAPLPALVSGVIAAMLDDSTSLEASRKFFEREDSAAGRTLVEALDTLRKLHERQRQQTVDPVARSRLSLKLSDIVLEDTQGLTVVGAITNRLARGEFFVRVCGIVQGDDLVALTHDESRNVIPETGDAIAFPDTVPEYHAALDSLAVWRVEFQSPDRRVRYVIKSFLSHVYDLFEVPHPSTDPDSVRYWLKEVYKHSPSVYPAFRLQDGLIVKFPSHATDPKLADFDVPLHGYESHPVVSWNNRLVIIKPFTRPDLRYDCAPVGKLVKRLIKSHAGLADMPMITNRQLNELADWTVREGSDPVLLQSLDRVKAQLGHVLSAKEQVDEVMADLLDLPIVRETIEAETTRLVERTSQEVARSRAQLASLEVEKKRCQAEIEDLREKNKKEALALSREIRKAFEKATSEGMATLANVALFKGVLGMSQAEGAPMQSTSPEDGGSIAEVAGLPADSVTDVLECQGQRISTPKDLDVQLARWYMYSGLSEALAKCVVAAVAQNGVVALVGSKREEIASVLVSTLAGGIDCNVSVSADMFGPADLLNATAVVGNASRPRAMPLGDFLEIQQSARRPTVVRLQGVNRAPPESVLPELLDLASDERYHRAVGWTDKKGNPRLLKKTSPIILVLDFANGRSVFPCMPPLAWEVPLIDTDLPYPESGEPTPGFDAPVAHVSPDFLRTLIVEHDVLVHSALDGLPVVAQRAARRMLGACQSLGLHAASAKVLSMTAFARGRLGGQEYENLIDAALDGSSALELASALQDDQRLAGQPFDIGLGQAK